MVDELPKLAVRIKVVSAILAGGAIGWGVFGVLMWTALGPPLFFLPGYAITVWYVVRTFSMPSYPVRELMWFFSLLIQGGWLLFGLQMIGSLFGILTETWWVFATAASAWAFWAEGELYGYVRDSWPELFFLERKADVA